MTAYYMIVDENGYISGFGTNGSDNVTSITEEEFDSLSAMIRNRPLAPEGYAYVLRNDPMEWVLIELPPEPSDEPIDEKEAFEILIGGAE